MGQEDSRPSNESTMSSATPPVLSHTDHENAARQDEGLLTPATVLTARATLSKVKQATVIYQCTDWEYKARAFKRVVPFRL